MPTSSRPSRSTTPDAPDSAEAARALRKLGFGLCRIDAREKKPTYKEWATRSLEPEDFDAGDQIGILGGPLSDAGRTGHALGILDLDSEAAIERADRYLPGTAMCEGRASKPRSHRYFLVPCDSIPASELSNAPQAAPAAIAAKGHAGPRTRSFRSQDGGEILRLIGTGGQAVCPPSLHPSGEERHWQSPGGGPGRPAVISYPMLLAKVEELVKACGWRPTEAVALSTREKPLRQAKTKLDGRLEHRISRYLDACPPAVAGRGGHIQLYRVAMAVVHGFALDPDDAVELLDSQYNPRCRPPWTLRDLQHKVEDAMSATHHKSRGHLIDGDGDGGTSGSLPEDTPALIAKAFDARVKVIVARNGLKSNRRGQP